MRDPLDPLDLEALEAAARERLDRGVYDYIAGGADDEHSVASAQTAWSRLRLRPRVLRDVSEVSMATTVLGNRLRDLRNGFRLPTGLKPANAPPAGAARQRELDVDPLAQAGQFDPGLTPEVIGWLADRSGLPVLVKGVLRGDDALACLEAGAAGVVVSNHGGRQLDTVVATADALAEVAAAVGDRGEVYVDGGVRRGTDVVKALALGARAVLVGRPVLWGLAVGGAAGVERVLSGLAGELRLAMALCGAPDLAGLTPDLVAGPGAAS